MHKNIRVKKGFTLIELIIVILLISIVSLILIPNFNFNQEKKYKLEIKNIKEFMLNNFEFENKLALECIEKDELDCYIFVDGVMQEDIIIKNLFNQVPKVYNFDRELSDYRFRKIKFDNHEYEPFFELKINSDNKHKNIVLDTYEDKVYLFSAISKKAKIFKNTNEVLDMMYDSSIEVRDAF
ncbi:prepilin-type N-terminal cleavage/methylation domain-containing protein [Halarcobacter sp.]|uniref:prepilin-type N-terminal cleavage/methylation domain-containing protein n=1 Tax=Halarcobacter sp. TaxID=2321133 RepID=UPI0029F55864|nr:prepilin-type N-terminal cleavage/methylation domain-containing protein [Halarcobacter sp.]